jgi:sugar (pentulose or hexulose) kinase
MSEPLVLVFDVGTQSTRGLLLDRHGVTVRATRDVYEEPYYSRNPNWAEQRPDFYFEHMCAVSRRLKEEDPDAFGRIVCVTLTVFRDSTVCMGADGKPLRDCILWMDQRQAEHPKPMPAGHRALFAAVGMSETIDMLQRTSACNWIAENEPELWARTDKYVCLSTYLHYRFTGVLADSYAGVMAKLPYDYKNRRWDDRGLTRLAYDVPSEKLCALVPSGTVLGGVTARAAELTGIPEGTPFVASGADKGCETLGLGVIGEDAAALSFGTSCTVQLMSRKYFEPTPFMPAYPAVPNDMYDPEIQILRGYWMLTWFIENFAQKEAEEAEKLGCRPEELLNAHLRDVPPGSDGLLVLPHWTPGLSTPNTRGAMLGFTDAHTKYHVYRAVIEGLNFALMEGLRTMEKRSGRRVKRLRLGGGGSRSDEICQLTADMFGLSVSRVQTNEASALGAAMCVYVSAGDYPDYAAAAEGMVRVKDTFEPDPAAHEVYERIYREVFTRIYGAVTPLHKRLGALTGGK